MRERKRREKGERRIERRREGEDEDIGYHVNYMQIDWRSVTANQGHNSLFPLEETVHRGQTSSWMQWRQQNSCGYHIQCTPTHDVCQAHCLEPVLPS